MSVGKRFKEAVDLIKITQGISIGDICKKIDISMSSLSQYKNGVINPNFSTIRRLESEFDVNYEYIVSGRGDILKGNDVDSEDVSELLRYVADVEVYESPVYANTGTVLPLEDYSVGKRKILFKTPIDDAKNFGALRVKGSSMTSEGILENDLVIFRKQSIAKDRQLVVIRLNGQLMVKIFVKNGKTIEFHSNDGTTEPLINDIDDCCEIIGIVTNVVRHV